MILDDYRNEEFFSIPQNAITTQQDWEKGITRECSITIKYGTEGTYTPKILCTDDLYITETVLHNSNNSNNVIQAIQVGYGPSE